MSAELAAVLVALLAGGVARRLGRMPEQASEVLNRFVIDLCLPATILRMVPGLRMRWDLLLLVLTPWLLLLIALLLTQAARRLFGFDRATGAALLLCTAIGNTSFLGFPLCSALLGNAALSLAVVYDQLGSFLMLCSVAPLLIARATSAPGASFAAIARGVLSFPPFLALLLALAPWPAAPDWLVSIWAGLLQVLGAALVPAAMFAVGLRLRVAWPPQRLAFGVGLALKLLILPACALGVCTLLGAAPAVRDVAVVESAMPCSITAGALAMAAGVAPELAAALVGWGVLLALLSVPGWAALLRVLPL